MTDRERVQAILHYQPYDKLPVVHFGYWDETKMKWYQEGHLTLEEAKLPCDLPPDKDPVGKKLGFDFGWGVAIGARANLFPSFEEVVIRRDPDGTEYYRNPDGVVVMRKSGVTSIPSEIEHTLVDRESWEEHYLPRLQLTADRFPQFTPEEIAGINARPYPIGLQLGSFYGYFRDWAGVVGTSYLLADDEELYQEIIDTLGNLEVECARKMLDCGIQFDYAHIWEDICFKNGPLVVPSIFREMVGPWYKKATDLVKTRGIDIISLDCDGLIDSLIPIWFENGVNTMFPIEVGVWGAELTPWREKYGKNLRGIGGMDKRVFAADYAAIDREIERLKPIIELGGYLPCPDHRLAPDAKWENVQYYTDKMQNFKL